MGAGQFALPPLPAIGKAPDQGIDDRAKRFQQIIGEIERVERARVMQAKGGQQPGRDQGARDRPAHHRIAIIQHRVAAIGGVFAHEIREQARPVMPRRPRLDIVRITRRDAQSHGAERRRAAPRRSPHSARTAA